MRLNWVFRWMCRGGRSLALGLLLGVGVSLVGAQTVWPTKPVRIVVPYPPGGANDILARVVSEKLSTAIGQPVLVDNRPGAGAVVGTEHVVRAAPDGYTFLMAASGPIVFNPALMSKLSYNPLRDLAPVSIVGSFPLVLGVREDFPARNLKELIQYTQARPNQSAYSHPTTSFQLVMEWLKTRTGMQGIHVPYQGSAPSVNAVLTGEVQMTLIDTGPIAPMLQAGKVRALAVTSDQRLANYPNVPTLKEQGVDLAVNLWSGLLAPAGTPVPIIARVQAEVARIMAMPDVVDRMNKLDIRPVGGTPAEMAKTIASEIELWSGVARANQITAQ
jgi:tripartite-type tricarboxylate transporter receptor subunit TctC